MNLSDGRSFILGEQPTWADFVCACRSGHADVMLGGRLSTINAALKAHQLRVEELPGVKEYIAKRPVTPY